MYNLAIRECTSPPLLAPRLKNENLLPRRGLNPGPAEPEADVLPSEPAWWTHKTMLLHGNSVEFFIVLFRKMSFFHHFVLKINVCLWSPWVSKNIKEGFILFRKRNLSAFPRSGIALKTKHTSQISTYS